jgi:hypothetical protein
MKLYSFQPETVDALRVELIAQGDVDGFMSAEVAARIFAAESGVRAVVCDVTHHPDRTPFRLITVMTGALVAGSCHGPTIAGAVEEIRAENLAAIELLPPTLV